MLFTDKIALSGTRRTGDGYLVADARVARTGIQTYLGREVGKPEMEQVRVFRPEAEVFSDKALASFAHRPVTNDHPAEAVGARNWKQHSVGMTGGDIARDGEFVRVPMTLMDQAAIDAVDAGKRELSMGYACDLDFTAGTTPAGEAYDAIQKNIRGNHLAIVDAGRAGPQCRIGDSWPAITKDHPMNLKTVTVDGIPIEVTDQGATVITTLLGRLADAAKANETLATDHAAALSAKDKELAAKDAEIDKLKANQLDANKIDQLAADRAAIVADARKVVADFDAAGKTNAQVKRAVVVAKLGDAMKDKSDDYIEARFDGLVADAAGSDPVRDVIKDLKTTDLKTVDSAHAAMVTGLQDAWMNKGAA